MAHWVNIVETTCDPTREDEYNDWYVNVHVHDVLKTPGYQRARRYQIKEFRDGRGKFMAIYDIETDDIEKTMRAREELRAVEFKAGRAGANRPNFSFPLWRDVLWKQIMQRAAPRNSTSDTGRWVNFVENNCDPVREEEFNDWYDNIHVPDILLTPSFVSATRFTIKDFRDGRGKYLSIYEIEADDIEDAMRIRLAKRAEEHAHGRASANRPHMSRPVWRDVLWKQLSEHVAA